MKHIIEVSRTDTDHIIVADLKNEYSMMVDLNRKDDEQVMNAIEVVLKHYMGPTEYAEWFRVRGTPLDSSYPDGDGYWKENE